MRAIILYLVSSFIISCNGDYRPNQDSDHVNKLNADRLHSMLGDMISKMQHYRFTHDPDIDYIALLKLHHLTAIEMAHREKEWGKADKMIAVAEGIIQDESAEVNEMDNYEHTRKPDRSDKSFYNEAQKLLLHEHTPSESGNIDLVFGEILLKHHQSAINISQNYLKYSNDISVRKLAEHVINHHTGNLAALQSVIRKSKNNLAEVPGNKIQKDRLLPQFLLHLAKHIFRLV